MTLRALVSCWLATLALCGVARAQPSIQPTFVPTLGPSNKTSALAFSANGRLLASAGDDGIAILWSVDAAAEVRRINAGDSALLFVQFCDGDRLLVTGAENGNAKIWNVASGREISSFVGHVSTSSHDYVFGAPFAASPDCRRIFTAREDGTGTVWDAESTRPVAQFSPAVGDIGYAAFAPDGAHLLVSGQSGSGLFTADRAPRALWRAKDDTGPVLFSADGRSAITSGNIGVRIRDRLRGTVTSVLPQNVAWNLSLSVDKSRLLAGTFSEGVALWDVARRSLLWRSRSEYGGLDSVLGVALAPDGRTFGYAPIDRRAGSWDGQIRIRDTKSFQEIRTLRGRTARLLSVGFNGTTPYILGADATRKAYLWSQRRTVATLAGHIAPVIQGVVSASGDLVVLGSLDNSVSLWEASGKQRFHMTGHSQYIASTVFSADNRRAYTAGGPAFAWDTESGRRLAQFGDHDLSGAVLKVRPSPDGTHVFTEAGGRFRLWASDGKEVSLPAEFTQQSRIGQGIVGVTVSEDGQLLLVDCIKAPGLKPLLEAAAIRVVCQTDFTGRVLQIQRGNGRERILTAAGSVAEVRDESGRHTFDHGLLLDHAALSADGAWLITASLQDNIARLWRVRDGLQICRLALLMNGDWVVFDADGRFDTSSIEDLQGMSWLLDEAPQDPLAMEVFMRDFYTPGLLTMYLTGETPPAVGRLANRDRTTPHVSFDRIEQDESGTTFSVQASISLPLGSSSDVVRDVTVFRDGQLVATVGPASDPLHVDPLTRTVQIAVRGIQLPSSRGNKAIDISAYAFNADRIKGPTKHETFTLQRAVPPRSRSAYIVTFGVNTFDDESWDLRFAANDARALSAQVTAAFSAGAQFMPIPVPLISERGGGATLAATKDNLRRVLGVLSGRDVGADAPGARWSNIKRATPDDIVIVHIATHGYTDASGSLFIVPSDSGKANPQATNPFGARAISGDELGEWLREIDAAEVTVILDTCQSAAIAGRDFKPAPLGDRGFGQLAYNKKMRVLVGAQSDLPALEVDALQHGLLSYSLAYAALDSLTADASPRDHSLTLGEWLQFPVQTLQKLQEDVQTGRIARRPAAALGGTSRGVKAIASAADGRRALAQQPSLLDFSSSRLTVMRGIPIFDRGTTAPNDVDQAEFDAAVAIDDPRASAEALRRFVAVRQPGGATAAAWVRIFEALVQDASAETGELVSAARLALSHLGLVGRSRDVDAYAVAICERLAEILQQRNGWPEVQAEFRSIVAAIRR